MLLLSGTAKSIKGCYNFSLIRQNVSRVRGNNNSRKPFASEVLTSYLKQMNEPPWTSYFVSLKDVINDQYGMSHFNWTVGSSNYTILRVGCYPYIKYHCTKAPKQDLHFEDKFYRTIKIVNLGK